jgi:hypothetical protein
MTAAVTLAAMGNGPAFYALRDTNYSITSGVITKVPLTIEVYDTANAFDSATNYRFQPAIAGYYQISGCAGTYSTGSALTIGSSLIYKNGSVLFSSYISTAGAACQPVVSGLVYLNGSTDYVELYGYAIGASLIMAPNNSSSVYMTGVMVRGA